MELSRIPIPCRAERYTDKSGPDGWWPTPEPPHRINQIYLELILFSHAEALPGLRIVNRAEVVAVEQSDDGVRARVRDLETGQTRVLSSRYLVGCDGGRSDIRGAIGATLAGHAVVQKVQSTFIRAPGLLGLMREKPAWGTFSTNLVRRSRRFQYWRREATPEVISVAGFLDSAG